MSSEPGPNLIKIKRRAVLQKMMEHRVAAVTAREILPASRNGGQIQTSSVQKGIWFLEQLLPVPSLHNIPMLNRASGELDSQALTDALNTVIARHEILRTTFAVQDGALMQVIAPSLVIPHRLVRPEGEDGESRERAALAMAQEEANGPFDLVNGPLLRWAIFEIDPQEYLLLLTVHHMIFDGWSGSVLFAEMATCYQAIRLGHATALPDLNIQYGDYAVWQQQRMQSVGQQSHGEYWQKQLAGAATALALPTDRPRPPKQTFHGASYTFTFPPDLTEALTALSQRETVTLFMTVLTAFAVLLHRYTQQDDILIGAPVANRHPETESLIGCFVNTVVLRADLSTDLPFRELLGRMRRVCLDAYAHQQAPFERVVEALQPERDLSRHPLFQAMFQLQASMQSQLEMRIPGITFRSVPLPRTSVQGDLFLDIAQNAYGMRGTFQYNDALFDLETILRMVRHLQTLLCSIVQNPELRLSQLPYLPPDETAQLLDRWNTTRADTPSLCVHELFEHEVERTPDAVAVEFEGETLTYRQLNERANQRAHALMRLGVERETRVALYLDRSLEMLVALLAVLKSGGAYIPLDPAYPLERINAILVNSAPGVILTERALAARLGEVESQILCLETTTEQRTGPPVTNPVCRSATEDLAYVIYTSGSTGQPKGVMIEHRALTNLLWSMRSRPGLTAQDVLLAVTTLSFDIAALELFLPLIVGARLIIAPRTVAIDGVLLAQMLEQRGVTVMQATPATWRTLVESGWRCARPFRALCGGETLSPELSERLLQSGVTLWNLYGPTETTIWSTLRQVKSPEEARSIGYPIANTQLVVLDRYRQPVPVGAMGELFIGGDGLARGYLNRPDLTAERFVIERFENRPGVRFYRTGDLCRRRPEGDIEFVGRTDHQVKVRGYRIEPGDIEAALAQHPSVAQSVVTVHDVAEGDRRLIAYIVGQSGGTIATEELRQFLRERLPGYMVPAEFLLLDALPMTRNGKIDRKALPVPQRSSQATHRVSVAPRTPEEKTLASLWSEVLGVERVGIEDNFFDLGGHSLLAVKLFSRMERAFGKKLSLATLFQAATIAQLIPLLQSAECDALWTSLAPIQPKGTAPPFFCVHAFGANLLNYRLLAAHLGEDQPFYGFQSRGLDGLQPPHVSVEEMATQYIAEMRSVRPHGPYMLGGGSSGGVIAFEMARQLVAAGESVALLALLDTYCPTTARESVNPSGRGALLKRIDRYLGHLVRLNDTQARWRYITRWLWGKLPVSRIRNEQVSTLPPTIQKVVQANKEALRRYVPAPYTGRITQLLVEETPERTASDPRLGWSALAQQGMEVRTIPGNHLTMLDGSHVATTATVLRACLRYAQSLIGK